MSRPTDHKHGECQLPTYEEQPPSYYTRGHGASSISITIPSDTNTSPTAASSSLLKSLQRPKKKSLQVRWHPSVNQLQAAKRNRQIYTLLGILAFFSSLTLALVYYSGCEIATGQCERHFRRSSGPPSGSSPLALGRGRKRLPVPALGGASFAAGVFGGEGLLMDHEVMLATGSKRYNTHSGRPWSFLYGRHKSSEDAGEPVDQLKEYSVGQMSGPMDKFIKHIAADGSEEQSDEDEYEDEDYVAGINDEIDLDDEDEDEDEDFTISAAASATPQEAYADIWNEEPDNLSEDDYLEMEGDYVVLSKAEEAHQRQSLSNRLDSDTKYMTYLPDAGLTNQFYGMLRAIMLAKSLERTLVLPPLTVSSYDNDGDESQQNQPWSSFFDLETFTYLTGVKVVEFQDLREPERILMASESLQCHVTCGIGSLRPLDSTAKEFLKQWKFELSMTLPEMDTSELDELVPALRSQAQEHMLCITNAYNIVVPKKEEWDLYGRYFYFTPTVERFFATTVRRLSEKEKQQQTSRQHRYFNDDSQERDERQQSEASMARTHLNDDQSINNNDYEYDRGLDNSAVATSNKLYSDSITRDDGNNDQIIPPHGPFISIHARRGDFVDFCQQYYQHDLQSCLPTTQELASTLHNLVVADPSLRGLPVYVSTNEDRPEELAEFRALGWHVLDHDSMGSRKRLGVFGPMMMDQIFMAQAQVLIGVRTSTFSNVGAYRQEDWYGRRAVFM